MRFSTLSSTVLTIPSFNSNIDSINGLDSRVPKPLAWNATGVDQYLSDLSISFTDHVSSMSESSGEPCQHKHHLTDSLVLEAADNYVRYSAALLTEVRLDQSRSVKGWERITEPHRIDYRLHKRVKRSGPVTNLDEAVEVAGHISQSEKPAWQLWKPESDAPANLAKMLIPESQYLPPPPNVIVRFTRYIKELTRITRERGSMILRKFGLKQRTYPSPVHSKTHLPSIQKVDPKAMDEKLKIERELLQQYNKLHRSSGLHEPADLDKMHVEMSKAMTDWNKLDRGQYISMRNQLKSDAETIILKFRENVQLKNAYIKEIIQRMQENPGSPSKSKGPLKFLSLNSKTSKTDKQSKKFTSYEKKFDEAMKIEVLPEVLNEELPLPNIKVDSSSVHPATEAFEAVGVKNKIPDIPPPRISFAPVDLLRTHSANIAYEMNLLQKEWSELYDRLAQREELKALNDARLETIEGMSILWRKLNHKYSSALKLENVQAVIDEQARAARRMKRERLAAVKEDTKRLAKLRFDHEQKKSRKHDLEVKEAKILSKSKRPQIDQLQDEMTKLEAEMARLRRNIDPENATGDKQTSEGVASTSASRLNKRQFEDVQEEITFSTQAKDVSKPSPLELLISTHVKVAFARPINSPGGMLSVLRGGLFADDDYVKSVKEDAKVLRELFEVSQSLRSTGACFTMGDSSRISTKGELVGCADRDLRHRITTESKSFRSISNVLLKASMHCRKANSIPTESWQVFSPCEVLPPMC